MDSGALDGLGAEHHRSRVAHFAARATNTFAYDQPNRLKTATVAGAGETYAYDGDGTRFSRQIGANPAIRYVSDPNASLPVTLDDGTHKYVWGLGLAYTVAGSGIEIYHADRLGSTRLLTDATGTITATYRTDEWGVATSQTGSSTQPFGYTGEPRDATGLTYLRARYYDPSLGRFMSRDGLLGSSARPLSLNRYAYGLQNPTRFRDPSGLWTIGVCTDVSVTILIFGFALQGCVVASSNLQVGFTGSGGGGAAIGASPVSATVGAVAQLSTADYIEDLAGPFDNLGGSGGAGLGGQGSGFWGAGRCGQQVYGATFGPTLTTPQAGAYFVSTVTATRTALGSAAPTCSAVKSQALR